MTRRTMRRLASVVGATLLLGCGSSTDPGSNLPGGLSISLNGTVVVQGTEGAVDGAIHLHLDEYSGLFVVEVLNERGRALDPDPELRLEAVIADGTKAAWRPPSEGSLRGEFDAFAEGSTTIVFQVSRQGSSTPEWTSPPVPLVIVACE